MQATVVLGGDQTIQENIDGDLDLVTTVDGEVELDVPRGADAELVVENDGEFTAEQCLDGEVGVLTKVSEYDVPVYTGATVVDPDFDGTVLQTAEKVVPSNITVNPIQVESVSNPYGGRTVYIGGVI